MKSFAGCYAHVIRPSFPRLLQKRRRLVELVDMGFKFDMAGLLADGLELDPSDVADASIANELLASGLKTLAAVKTVTGGKSRFDNDLA